ncbi:MAG: response regulator [Candidatus Lokiarchaeota archaeon]|nr:response regulator [Candidatus Lokiarchaeota archaeon]
MGFIMKDNILICDDEPDIVFLTDKFLKHGDYKTITCNNGKEALKIIEDKFDDILLVLLDLMMPGLSGFEVLRSIKNDERYKDILVILFTVKSFKEDIQKGKDLGADGYITKPFKGEDLLNYVKDILKKKKKK